jgi:hypothetical protein
MVLTSKSQFHMSSNQSARTAHYFLAGKSCTNRGFLYKPPHLYQKIDAHGTQLSNFEAPPHHCCNFILGTENGRNRLWNVTSNAEDAVVVSIVVILRPPPGVVRPKSSRLGAPVWECDYEKDRRGTLRTPVHLVRASR